ncbi:hypothetical protein KJ359_007059 [Pestalotiopsis sp. 9143b]|nr:hypothetical protein KJ359_007059 [Pestalotiopsis sp. 9143b]
MKALMTDCVLVWQRRICAPHNVAVFAPLLNAVVRHGWHGVDSPLTSFLVDWIALTSNEAFWDVAQMKSLPPNIVAEIFRRTLRCARYGVDTVTGVPDPNLDWCRYHAHGPGQEKVACMARRPFDWDVRARRGQVAPAEPQYLFTANRQAVQGALPPPGPVEGQAQNVGPAGIMAEEEGPKIKADEQKTSVKGKGKKRRFNPKGKKPCAMAGDEKAKLKVEDQTPNLKAEEEEPPKKK